MTNESFDLTDVKKSLENLTSNIQQSKWYYLEGHEIAALKELLLNGEEGVDYRREKDAKLGEVVIVLKERNNLLLNNKYVPSDNTMHEPFETLGA